jgi:hypothetical protein
MLFVFVVVVVVVKVSTRFSLTKQQNITTCLYCFIGPEEGLSVSKNSFKKKKSPIHHLTTTTTTTTATKTVYQRMFALTARVIIKAVLSEKNLFMEELKY